MKYGYFSEDGKKFIITNPLTPKPWVNVISNGNYSCIVSQTGSGYSFRTHSQLNRITRWFQDLVKDDYGKYFYLRDNDSGGFHSLTYRPTNTVYDKYECIHTQGYTEFITEKNNILANYKIAVSPEDDIELFIINLKNNSKTTKNLSLFSYLEWNLGVGPDVHREFHKIFIETYFTSNTMLATKRLWGIANEKGQHGNREWEWYAFHSSNLKVSAYESDKTNFIGNYQDLNDPIAVKNGKLNNIKGKWYDAISSLKTDFQINPGENKEIIYALGIAKNRKKALELRNKYLTNFKSGKFIKKVNKFWDSYLNTIHCETPDRYFNILNNIWFKYQAISSRFWARSGYYQAGGAFGYRDQLQDSQLFLYIDTEVTRKQILLHAEHQFFKGNVQHWWHPIINDGMESNYSDTLLWLPYLTFNYIKETGDYSILNEKTRYVDNEKKETLFEHIIRAIDYSLTKFSKRGLPLIGSGDWNDGLNTVGWVGQGESIFVAQFLYGILNSVIELIETAVNELPPLLEDYRISSDIVSWTPEVRKDIKRNAINIKLDYYKLRAKDIIEKINTIGWDGEWFVRAFRDNGKVIGSSKCKEGSIFLNTQVWAIINNTTNLKRKKKGLRSAEKHLLKNNGPILFYPAYRKPDKDIGYLTRYAAGVRENGGVYTHAALWLIIAEAMMGRGDKCYEIFNRLCPANRLKDIDRYMAEPYVTPGNIDGPDSPLYGRGGWTWYTGSAAWAVKVSMDWILGARACYKGLIIDPCIPRKWEQFTLKRKFRGAVYNIKVLNPDRVSKGIKYIKVNGKKISGNIIKRFKKNKEYRIEVIMGDPNETNFKK